MKRFTKTSKMGMIAVAASALTIAGGALSGVTAQPGGDPAAGARRGKGKGQRGQRGGARAIAREIAMVENATGKTLTEAQKSELRDAIMERRKATKAAQDKYMASVSKVTGLTSEELRAKMRAARQQRKGPGQ